MSERLNFSIAIGLLFYDLLLCCLSVAAYPYNINPAGKITHIHRFCLAAAAGLHLFRNLAIGVEYFIRYFLVLPFARDADTNFIDNRVGKCNNGYAVLVLFTDPDDPGLRILALTIDINGNKPVVNNA